MEEPSSGRPWPMLKRDWEGREMDLIPCRGAGPTRVRVTEAVEIVGRRNCGGSRSCCRQLFPVLVLMMALIVRRRRAGESKSAQLSGAGISLASQIAFKSALV